MLHICKFFVHTKYFIAYSLLTRNLLFVGPIDDTILCVSNVQADAEAAAPRYVPRIADGEFDRLLLTAPAIAIEGPLGVGKTTTARRRAATVHALDDPAQLSAARAQPQRLCEGKGPVLIDECTRVTEAWDLVRQAIADGAQPGHFLLTSSTTLNSLGREVDGVEFASLRMRPLALAERGLGDPSVSLGELLEGARGPLTGTTSLGLEDYAREIVVSGLPALRGCSEAHARAQIRTYLQRLIGRELRARRRLVRDPRELWRWLTAYAAATSLATSFQAIDDRATGDSPERQRQTLNNSFRNALKRLWIIDPVAPWPPARAGRSGARMELRHQLADPAFAALLLGADVERLLGPPHRWVAGVRQDPTLPTSLFESLVTLSLRVYAQAIGAKVSHLYGSADWPDVELMVEGPDERVVAIAVAISEEDEDRRADGLAHAAELLEHTLADAIVITTGREARRRSDGIAMVPAVLLGP